MTDTKITIVCREGEDPITDIRLTAERNYTPIFTEAFSTQEPIYTAGALYGAFRNSVTKHVIAHLTQFCSQYPVGFLKNNALVIPHDTKINSIFAKSFRWQSFRGIKESALLLVKSPNLNKEYTRHGAAHIRGLPIRVVYSGVWRYLQENTEGSPLSLPINIVISPSWLSAENSCKIRHYEKIFVVANRHLVQRILLGTVICSSNG